MTAYYNEIEPFAAQWLRNLIAAGHIAPGVVDTRDIRDVKPHELARFTQCHFFAGIGVWSYALRRAGWPDDRPVWTGSCPCQPFSSAGKRSGFADERHLWPAWHWLIEQCRPERLFGEQVSSPDGIAWLDAVQTDLEGSGYASGAIVFPAAGIGAPHGRHRTYWMAYDDEAGRLEQPAARVHDRRQQRDDVARCGADGACAVADTTGCGLARQSGRSEAQEQRATERGVLARAVGDSGSNRDREHARELSGDESEHAQRSAHGDHASVIAGAARATAGFWRDADWLPCIDGRSRPVEPGTFPLAHGAPARVGRLRAYGNAIVSEAAELFIRASMD